jgi:glycogen(starch) synthase
MRILHLTTEFPPVIYGGLGTAVGGWVTGSSRSGLTAGVLLVEGPLADAESASVAYGHPRARAAHTGGVIERDGITFFQASSGEAIRVGIQAVRQWRPDIIHLHTAMIWHVADAIREHTTKPIVYHVHSVDRAEYEIGHEPNQWLAQAIEQGNAIHASNRLIAISDSERELLDHYYPEDRDRVRVVGNGIADSARARRSAARPRDTDSPLVLYSGRLVERKGIHELLAAIPSILQIAPSARFVLAGGPPHVTPDELKRQWMPHELAAHSARVQFTGWLTPSQLERWYAAADVLVVPSRYEPFGMVVLEGMLHGLPIVATDIGGPAEILKDASTGLLVAPRDSDALSNAISRLVTDPGMRIKIGSAAAREVRRRWTWPQRVRRMQAVYRELIPVAA